MTAGCAGRICMSKFDPESWRRAVAIFRDAIRDNPGFSPCYSSLVQMNNIEHFVHPGSVRDLEKAQRHARTGEDRRSTRPRRFKGASVLWLVLHDGAAGGGGRAAHAAGLRAQRQRPVDAAVQRPLFDAFCGSIEQARLRAEQSLALSPAPSYLEWAYHCTIRFLCGDYAGALEACDRAHGIVRILPAWRAAALFYLGEPRTGAAKKPSALSTGCALSGSDHRRRPTRPWRAGSCRLIRSA